MVALLIEHSAKFRPAFIVCIYYYLFTFSGLTPPMFPIIARQHKHTACRKPLNKDTDVLSVSNHLLSSLTGSRCLSCSGKRKITLFGSRLEFVEGVIHSHAPQKVQPPISINYQVALCCCLTSVVSSHHIAKCSIMHS